MVGEGDGFEGAYIGFGGVEQVGGEDSCVGPVVDEIGWAGGPSPGEAVDPGVLDWAVDDSAVGGGDDFF